MTSRQKWDLRFMELAQLVSSWSKDPKVKVGAVIVDDNIVVGMGFNGFPRFVKDREDRLHDKESKRLLVVHAELNAILHGRLDRHGIYMLFATRFPCSECAKAICQTGISRVVAPRPSDEMQKKTWHYAEAMKMFEEGGIQVVEL